jgi:hypothetical protein
MSSCAAAPLHAARRDIPRCPPRHPRPRLQAPRPPHGGVPRHPRCRLSPPLHLQAPPGAPHRSARAPPRCSKRTVTDRRSSAEP